MRLTALKLAGFKSFVDSTTLPLPTNLTAVVGPNGSGKSNLIDAVRWVLGESSSKALRGADSQDVIFNGAKSRKPGGRASVELLFDNSDQTVQGEWGRYNEIAVRREVIRGGTAQYFINGQRCLKRDVVDLFLGTGLGGRNQYAILEQGTVAQLVEAKPDELRRWLEEAAGISRYKERRRETESRIRQTRDNLARLGDLQSEIDKRLKVLTRQAADAERFNQSKAQERRLRAELLLLRRQNVERESAQRKARIEDAIGELEQARTLLSERDSARQMAESVRNQAGETFNAAQAEMYQAEAVRSRSEQSLAHAREMQAVHEREVEASEARLAQLGERIEREKAQTVELEKELANVQSEGVAASSNEQQAAASLATAEAALAEEQRLWEGFEQRAQTPILEAERERSNVQASEKAAEGLAARLQRLDEERAALDEKPLQAALFDSDSELEALEAEIAQVRVRLDDGDTRLQALRGERDSNESTLNEARDALQDVRGRCASLETLQQAALRSDDQALTQWLDARGWQQRPRLADQLRVGGGWETAVEHVLSGLLQAPVLESWRPADMPPTGPASGVATVAGGSSGDAALAASLASHVQGPPVVREWLDSVQVADSDSEALATLEKLEPGASVITANGVWRGRGWVRYPCADAADSGVIARGKLLREVQIRRESLAAQVQRLSAIRAELDEKLQALEGERKQAAARADQLRETHGRCLGEREAKAARLDQTRQRAAAVAQELQSLYTDQQARTQALEQRRGRLAELEHIVAELKRERETRVAALQQARVAERGARQQHATALGVANQAQVRTARQVSTLEAARRNLESLDAQWESQQQQLRQTREQGSGLQQPLQQQSEALAQASQTVEAANQRLRQCRENIERADGELQKAQHALQAAMQRRDQVQENLQQLRLAHEGDRSRCEAFDAQLAETHQDVEKLKAELSAEADIATWEERLEKVARRIERLGAINLAAIPELEETQERASYLEAQRTDLEQALTTLEDAMAKLDAETRDMFRDTYKRVDERFQQCCPRLFNGGEANLERTSEDWLSTGVRVMVRPPGKRNTAIQSLSGGEKALSALALLFALFELNPAPFCLLDEVEAPLDDVNVRRFCDLVRDMSQNVQFIIITHNKLTMELGEHLHGVTMREPGVSRLVSVDVREAERLAEPADAMTEV